MKKIIFNIMAVSLVMTSFTSCKKYLDDVATNPNNPSEVSPNALLANIELATFSNYNGNLNRRAAVLTNHMAGEDGQFVAIANYQINEGDVTNEWSTIYDGALINCHILSEKFGAKSPYFNGMAKVLKAMNLGLATDMWGDVPNRDAYQALQRNFTPKYDDQQTVLQDIQTMLSEAITDLSKPLSSNLYTPGGYDYIYHGDPEKWIGAAYALKARYANRLSKRDPNKSATDAIAYLDSAYAHGFTATAADANATFGMNGNENNQWYAFENQRTGYLKMGDYFIKLMKTNSDPRLPYFAGLDDHGAYTGADNNPYEISYDESPLGPFYGSPQSKAPIITYVEAKFIEAECKLRAGNGAGAAIAHNDAVRTSVLDVTGSLDSAFVADYASETASTLDLTIIIKQKYVALFTQAETWADWRRTGIPKLVVNDQGVLNEYPRILPTPKDERNCNPYAPSITNLLTRVWWDK